MGGCDPADLFQAHIDAAQRRVRAEHERAPVIEAHQRDVVRHPAPGQPQCVGHAAGQLPQSAPGLDAIFCGNDQIARGVADTLRAAGRRIPEDVALVGFDNWEVIATACRPPLTTVDMNLRYLGRVAGERLLSAVDGGPSSGLQMLPFSLVVRESSRSRPPH